MNPTTRFSNRVENYVCYRPDYPLEVIDLMRDEMNLRENSIVADIGSGTGIFARMLLERNCIVWGVEPNIAMRAAGKKFLNKFDKFKSVDGTAENANLPDKSVNIITVAQAFHWFDIEPTKREFKRILQSDGYVALIWNNPRLDADAFSINYKRLLNTYGDQYEIIRKSYGYKASIETFFDNNFSEKSFPNSQTLDFKGLEGRTLSSSFMPTAQDKNFSVMIDGLRKLFEQHQRAGKVKIFYETKVFYGTFNR
jgi:ubiquinone/menaquinone biosynthesis C-methylase UbiE